jgi:hypothetical protein
VNRSSGSFILLAAVLTTILSIVVFMVLSRVSPKVQQPQSTIYAVTR